MDCHCQMPESISRRELLRRGAKYGGAAVFATPVINVLSMAEAGATTGGSSYGHSHLRDTDDRRSASRGSTPDSQSLV